MRAKVGREKQLKVEQIIRQYPHDPDHPGTIKSEGLNKDLTLHTHVLSL